MIKEILAACDYSLFAEAALLMFVSIFLVVSLRTLAGSPREARRNARIALTDSKEENHHA